MHELTLAENKLILSPKTDGLELLKLTVLEMILNEQLSVIKSRNPKESVSAASFLQFKSDADELGKKLIFRPLAKHLGIFKKFQFSLLLKFVRSDFNSDFEKYKTDYVLKNLRDQHKFVAKNLFDKLRGKYTLTEEGKAHKQRLKQEVQELKEAMSVHSAYDHKQAVRLMLVAPLAFQEIAEQAAQVKSTPARAVLQSPAIFGDLSAVSILNMADGLEFANEELADAGSSLFQGLMEMLSE